MKFKNFYNRISYAIVPFLIFVAVLLISYFGNQLLYSYGVTINKNTNYPHIPLDEQIPLVPWLVYFYYLTFPLGIIAFFYLAYVNKRAFYNLFITLVISFAISGVFYLFAQTVFTKPEFEPVTFTDKLVVWTWGSTNPINCFPSQHCFMAFAIIIGMATANSTGAQGKMNIIFKLLASIIAIFIICSTVLIKQHFLLDIVASFDIMFIIYPIVCLTKSGEISIEQEEKVREFLRKRKAEKLAKK